jgi:hypothetical protein
MIDIETLFERRMSYPFPDARDRLARLIGIDEQKQTLTKLLALLVNAGGLKRWKDEHHPGAELVLDSILNRPRLVILAGDVGS